jgi:tRNA(adenine34) deaminase
MSDDHYMAEAIRQAKEAFAAGEVPVGAVIVANGRILGRGRNQTELLQDVTAHAEIIAITAAAGSLGAKYLTDCTLYVTLEPCAMCAGALFWSQIGRIVYGASDEKRGYSLLSPSPLHPKTQVTAGVRADECAELVRAFFRDKRG